MIDVVTPDFNPGSGWVWTAASAVGTDNRLAGSDGFDSLNNPHKTRPTNPFREMDRACGTEWEVGPL